MRNDVTFYLNGRRRVVPGRAAFGPLAEYLRDDCRLVGTKVGCGEGDCGACTVLVGRPSGGVDPLPAGDLLHPDALPG